MYIYNHTVELNCTCVVHPQMPVRMSSHWIEGPQSFTWRRSWKNTHNENLCSFTWEYICTSALTYLYSTWMKLELRASSTSPPAETLPFHWLTHQSSTEGQAVATRNNLRLLWYHRCIPNLNVLIVQKSKRGQLKQKWSGLMERFSPLEQIDTNRKGSSVSSACEVSTLLSLFASKPDIFREF